MSDAQTNAPAPREAGSLDRSLIHGIAWTAAAKWLSQLVTWLVTLIVARILTPEDYGLVGMAQVFLGMAALVSEFGFGTSIVITRDIRREQVAQLNSLALFAGLACCAFSLLIAKPLGAFYGADALPTIVAVMSASFVIGSFRTVPMGLLQKELRFKLLAGIEASQSILTSIASVTFAVLGLRYWTLVFAGRVNTAAASVLVLCFRRHTFAIPRSRDVRPLLGLSSNIITSRVAWYVYTAADFLVIGRVLGEAALGAYTLGWTLASLPVEKITVMVARVTPAVFAAVQTEPAELRRYLLRITQMLALVVFPLAWGLALVAPEFVLLALGEKWRGAILPLQLLAFYAAFRSITPLLTHVLNVTGNAHFSARVNVIAAIVLPAGFVVGTNWGTGGVAAAWIVLHPLVMTLVYWRVFRAIDLAAGAYLRALWPALSSGALMGAALFALQPALPADWPLAALLAIKIAAGGAAYGLALLVLHRESVETSRDVLRSLRSR